MGDDDMIRRGDALALTRHDPILKGVREDWAGMVPDEDGDWVSFDAIAALPAVSAPVAVRMKPLVWEPLRVAGLHAFCPLFRVIYYADDAEDAARQEATRTARIMAAIDAPDVAELVEALDNLLEAISAENQHGDRSLTITGPTLNLKWLLEAQEDARAVLAKIGGQ